MIPGAIHVGYVHPGMVYEQFSMSLLQAFKYSDRLIAVTGSQSARQFVARNENIEAFLKGQGEWYIQIDTDMTFRMTAIDDLVEAAEKAGAKAAGALCFGYTPATNEVFPGIWKWDDEEKQYHNEPDYEEDARFTVDATGAAFLLTHRSLLEELGAPWHENHISHPDTGKPMGHDISFCHRIRTETDNRILYCADIKIGHIKRFTVNEDTYRAYRRSLT